MKLLTLTLLMISSSYIWSLHFNEINNKESKQFHTKYPVKDNNKDIIQQVIDKLNKEINNGTIYDSSSSDDRSIKRRKIQKNKKKRVKSYYQQTLLKHRNKTQYNVSDNSENLKVLNQSKNTSNANNGLESFLFKQANI